jgi:hypothetical protein
MMVSPKDVMYIYKFKPKFQIFKTVGTNIKEISIFAFELKHFLILLVNIHSPISIYFAFTIYGLT